MTAGPVMIMAGGTGGHVFPGLAVADALRARDCGVVWLGTRGGLEARLVPEHGIDIHFISIGGVRGKRTLAWIAAPFRIVAAIIQALSVLRRCRPSVVLGMGGFVAGPGGVAAWLSRKPLIIHEQNAVAGTTNRLLSRIADRVFQAFPDSFARSDAMTIGNPVRESIFAAGHDRPVTEGRARLLVFGGSQGAEALNRLLPAALALLPEDSRPAVRHQAGRFAAETAARYREAGVAADVTEFIPDMAAAYREADLVVARAGALTVAELAAAGVGAILVPLPHAIDDHQTRNAEHFVRAGAGRLLTETEASPAVLRGLLEECLARKRHRALSAAALALAQPEATAQLADACLAAAEAVA